MAEAGFDDAAMDATGAIARGGKEGEGILKEFFGPIPVGFVIGAVAVATLVTLISCAPNRWVELVERALRKRRARS